MSEFQDAENWEAFMEQGREPYTPDTLGALKEVLDRYQGSAERVRLAYGQRAVFMDGEMAAVLEALAKAVAHADAWLTDRKRVAALERVLWFEHYRDVYPGAAINHGDCEACRLLAALREADNEFEKLKLH